MEVIQFEHCYLATSWANSRASLVVWEVWSLISDLSLRTESPATACFLHMSGETILASSQKYLLLHQLVLFKVQLSSTLSLQRASTNAQNASATLHGWERVYEYSSTCLKTTRGLQTALNIQHKVDLDAWMSLRLLIVTIILKKMDATTSLMWHLIHFLCASINISHPTQINRVYATPLCVVPSNKKGWMWHWNRLTKYKHGATVQNTFTPLTRAVSCNLSELRRLPGRWPLTNWFSLDQQLINFAQLAKSANSDTQFVLHSSWPFK